MKKIFLPFLFLFPATVCLRAQHNAPDSLRQALHRAPHDTVRAAILSELVWVLSGSDPAGARPYARQELALGKKMRSARWMAQGYNDLGILLYMDGEYDSALLAHQQAYRLRQQLNDDLSVASSLSKISACYSMKGAYGRAIDYALQTLRIYEKQKDMAHQALMLDNLAEMSRNNLDHERAIQYSQRAIALFTQLNDEYYIAKARFGLAQALQGKKEYEQADQHLRAVQKYFEQQPGSYMLSSVYNSRGVGLRGRQKDREALVYYGKAYAMAREAHDDRGISIYANNLGCTYTDLGHYALAEKYCLEALAVTDTSSLREFGRIHLQLARIYAFLNQGEKSRQFTERYLRITDSMYSLQSARQAAEMQVKYETEKKEADNRLLRQQDRLNKAELENSRQKISVRNRTIVLLAVVLLLVLLLVLWRINHLRLKRKQAELELLQQNQREKERISRDLHDNVGGQLSYVLYSLHDIAGENKEKREAVVQGITESVRLVVSSLRETIWAIHDEEVGLHDLADRYKLYVRNLFRHSTTKVVFHEKIQAPARFNALTGLNLYRICQEIANNMYKHAHATEIRVSIEADDQKTCICISDNGRGFDPAAATGGYGLGNLYERSSESGIGVTCTSSPGKGTQYTLIV